MTSPGNDRTIRLARRATLWMIGPIVLLLRGPITGLTPPVRCGAALELLSILIVRAWPSLQIGSLFAVLQMVAVVIAFGCYAELAFRASGSVWIAIALAIALAVSHMFVAALAPPWSSAAFAACAAVALALIACLNEAVDSPRAPRAAGWAAAALGVAAGIVPFWTAPCGLCAAAIVWRGLRAMSARTRIVGALLAATAVVGTSLLVTKLANQAGSTAWTACVWPTADDARFSTMGRFVDVTGPLVLALAFLGAYVSASSAGLKRTACVGASIVFATASTAGTNWPAGVGVAPIQVVVWCLAAVGLQEMCGRVESRPIIAGLLVAAVPVLQLSRPGMNSGEPGGLVGHERASLAQVWRLLNLVPAGATIVEEDASVELLVRAAAFGGRLAKPLGSVRATRKDVGAALNAGRVYAFPLGQRELSLRGFVIDAIEGVSRADSQGIASVSATRACVELGRTWADLAEIGVHGRVSLVADSGAAVGPVVIYFSGATGYTPGPDGWSARMMPGFALRMFDRSTPARSALVDAEAAAAGLPDHPVFAAPYVARLTLFRAPGAPLAMPIVLGPPRDRSVGRLISESADALPMTLCDAPAGALSEF